MHSNQTKNQFFTEVGTSYRYSMDSFDTTKTVSRLSVVDSDQSSSFGSIRMIFEESLDARVAADNEHNTGIDWSYENNFQEWKKSQEKIPGKSSKIIIDLELDETIKYHKSFILSELNPSEPKEKELPDLSLPFTSPPEFFYFETVKPKKRYHSLSKIEYQINHPIHQIQADEVVTKDVRDSAYSCDSAYNGEDIDLKTNMGSSLCFDPIDDGSDPTHSSSLESLQETSFQTIKPSVLLSRSSVDSKISTRSSYDDPMLSYPSAMRIPPNDDLGYAGISSADFFLLAPIIEETRAECLRWKNYKPTNHTMRLNNHDNQKNSLLSSTRKVLVRCQTRIKSLVSPQSKNNLSTTISPIRSVSPQSSHMESELSTPVLLSSQTTCNSDELDQPSEPNLHHRKSNLSRLVHQAKSNLQKKLSKFMNRSDIAPHKESPLEIMEPLTHF